MNNATVVPDYRSSSFPSEGSPLMQANTAWRIIVYVMLFLAMVQVCMLLNIGNGLSPTADPYSEANSLRAADAYRTHGFKAHYGLPRIFYGKLFPNDGAVIPVVREYWTEMGILHGDPDECAYTHYPPGPDWIVGILASIFGMDHIWLFRLVPITVGLACAAIFFVTLAKRFGADRAAIVAVGCALLPMFSDHMHGLHYQGYSLALLLLQMALLIQALWAPTGTRWGHVLGLLILGFLQGWLSFDQCFVVTFLAVPLWAMRRAEGAAPSWRWLIAMVLVTGLGFTFAHFLHFLLVVGERGGAAAALADLRHAASFRAGMFSPKDPTVTPVQGYLILLLLAATATWLVLQSPRGPFGCGLPLMTIVAGLALLLWMSRRMTVNTERSTRRRFHWVVPRGWGCALLAALLVSAAWMFVMPQHADAHTNFIPRHYFVFYICALLLIVRCLQCGGSGVAEDIG